jgi:hypothetical protein
MAISHSFRASRGSVLLIALMFAAIIGVSLSSYIALANNSLKQSSRSFYASSAVNLAESGLELAVACFNQVDEVGAAAAWTGWTLDNTPFDATGSPFTPSAVRTLSGFDLGPGATGTVKIFAHHYAGSTAAEPKLVAQATITQAHGPAITKIIEVTLRKRSLLGDGVSAIENITCNGGNFQGHSWDSDPDNSASTAPEAYPGTLGETANLTMGSVSGNINLGSGGEVWGYAKVSDETHTITGGSVHGAGSAGTADDPARRTDDFDANFPTPTPPSPTIFSTISSDIVNTATFPRGGDNAETVGTEQIYYYKFSASSEVRLNNNETLTIEPNKNVVFIMTSHETNAQGSITISGTGAAGVYIGANSTFNLYTNGDVSIAGSGVVNPNLDTKSFMVWGTETVSPTSQDINIKGNGVLTGVVYAPNAAVTLSGGGASGGTMYGAVVGRSVTFNGNTSFYYDEALADLTFGNPYGPSKWKELQSAGERQVYATVLGF